MEMSKTNKDLLKSLLERVSLPNGKPYTILYAKDMRESSDLAFRAHAGDEIMVDLDQYYELGTIRAKNEEQAFYKMQGDIWSPTGEARPAIMEAPIHHTSMSVGDLLRDGNRLMMVAPDGFVDITMEVEEWN